MIAMYQIAARARFYGCPLAKRAERTRALSVGSNRRVHPLMADYNGTHRRVPIAVACRRLSKCWYRSTRIMHRQMSTLAFALTTLIRAATRQYKRIDQIARCVVYRDLKSGVDKKRSSVKERVALTYYWGGRWIHEASDRSVYQGAGWRGVNCCHKVTFIEVLLVAPRSVCAR